MLRSGAVAVAGFVVLQLLLPPPPCRGFSPAVLAGLRQEPTKHSFSGCRTSSSSCSSILDTTAAKTSSSSLVLSASSSALLEETPTAPSEGSDKKRRQHAGESSIDIPVASAMFVPAKASASTWRFLVPKPWENPRGWDRTVEWDCRGEKGSEEKTERILDAARELLPPPRDDGGPSPAELGLARRQLAGYMATFGDFSRARRCRARLVASRGGAGTKCPQFHLDHVPVRWIQSLFGPGCEYVAGASGDGERGGGGGGGVDWTRINNLGDDIDDLSVADRNRLLVGSDAAISQVPEGQAVMLLGTGWKEWAIRTGRTSESEQNLPPVVHKSPSIVAPWQGRVFLSMDIVE